MLLKKYKTIMSNNTTQFLSTLSSYYKFDKMFEKSNLKKIDLCTNVTKNKENENWTGLLINESCNSTFMYDYIENGMSGMITSKDNEQFYDYMPTYYLENKDYLNAKTNNYTKIIIEQNFYLINNNLVFVIVLLLIGFTIMIFKENKSNKKYKVIQNDENV